MPQMRKRCNEVDMIQGKMIKIIEAFLLSIAAIFAPIQGLLGATAFMVISDLVTGVMAAKKRGEKITSSGLRRTVSKLFIYELAIMFAFIAEHFMSSILPFVKMASAMVSVVELKSIYENLNVIGGCDLLKTLIDKLGSPNLPIDKK